MIASLTNLFSKVIANLQEYTIMAVVALIGGLVAALKLQGFQLHRAQVLLLKGQIEAKEAANAEITQKAYDTYKDALNSYIQAGGTMLILLASLWLPSSLHAATNGPSCPQSPLFNKCVEALSDCDKLQRAQEMQIADLHEDVDKLVKQVSLETTKGVDAAGAAGFVVGGLGGAVVMSLKGFVIGGALGAIVGFGVGLLMGGF